MRYYTIKVETTTDGTENRDLRGYDTYSEALVKFHSDLAKYVNNTGSILEMVIDANGLISKSERWVAEATTEATE